MNTTHNTRTKLLRLATAAVATPTLLFAGAGTAQADSGGIGTPFYPYDPGSVRPPFDTSVDTPFGTLPVAPGPGTLPFAPEPVATPSDPGPVSAPPDISEQLGIPQPTPAPPYSPYVPEESVTPPTLDPPIPVDNRSIWGPVCRIGCAGAGTLTGAACGLPALGLGPVGVAGCTTAAAMAGGWCAENCPP